MICKECGMNSAAYITEENGREVRNMQADGSVKLQRVKDIVYIDERCPRCIGDPKWWKKGEQQ